MPSTDPISGGFPPHVLQETAAMFGLLSASVRLHILWLLSEGDRDVSTLAEETEQSVATVSHHLGKLKLAGLVRDRRQGKRRVYVVTDNRVVDIVRGALETQQPVTVPVRVARITPAEPPQFEKS